MIPPDSVQCESLGKAPFTASDPLAIAEVATWQSRRSHEQATHAARVRSASGRRRFVDPATCERDCDSAEIESKNAMQEYKRKSGRPFPTWSEVLHVLRSLGYQKMQVPQRTASIDRYPQSARRD
jgi:hypothetical protein